MRYTVNNPPQKHTLCWNLQAKNHNENEKVVCGHFICGKSI